MTRQQTKTGDLSKVLSRKMAVFRVFHGETWNTSSAKKLNDEMARDAESKRRT